MSSKVKIELVAPAGNLGKLKAAIHFGADAVYVGGHIFGLRKFADNFTVAELAYACEWVHVKKKRIYLVLNGFAKEEDMAPLRNYLRQIKVIPLDAVIIADFGVLKLVKDLTPFLIHISTQASVTNQYSAALWKHHGAKRIVLARELTLGEIRGIRETVDIELEVFGHGSMCASYSGKCTISSYTAGRDSNRGGCVQSCRFAYVKVDSNPTAPYIMNAKDLLTIEILPELLKTGVHSIKIEGRMKSVFYVANTVQAYRQAIDTIDTNTPRADLIPQLNRVSNRDFCAGGLIHRPGKESIATHLSGYKKASDFVGQIKYISATEGMIIDVKSAFKCQDTLCFITPNEPITEQVITSIHRLNGQKVEASHPNMLVKIPYHPALTNQSIAYIHRATP